MPTKLPRYRSTFGRNSRWIDSKDKSRAGDAMANLTVKDSALPQQKPSRPGAQAGLGVAVQGWQWPYWPSAWSSARTRSRICRPFGPPGAARGIEVWHEGRFIERAKPLDAYANCFVRRRRPTQGIQTDTPAAPPVASGPALRELRRDDKENG